MWPVKRLAACVDASWGSHSSVTQCPLWPQFLRILRSLPYGNSIFFPVKRIEDPIGLLPAKLILGVNKRGVHFFRWGGLLPAYGGSGWGPLQKGGLRAVCRPRQVGQGHVDT